MKLSQTEERLFALLRAGLQMGTIDATSFADMTAKMWNNCYRLAAQHGVMAVAWDGMGMLPAHLQPPRALKLTWGLAVQKYEERYSHYCSTIDELSRLYARHNITTVQFKGVGLSTCYPVPAHREGGDIDIYTCSADLTQMSDKEANQLADDLMKQQGMKIDNISRKHSNFFYKGVPIENHKTFLDIKEYKYAAQTDLLLRQLLQPQTTLLDGKHEILTPSVDFNMIFIAFHAASHYGNGFSLHHLCDWACLIRKYGLHIPKEITDRRFLNMIQAMTLLCNKYLGTSVKADSQCEKLAEDMLKEMLHPAYSIQMRPKSKLGIFVYKTRWLLHRIRLVNTILELSPVNYVWESIMVHIRNPKTIFGA